MVNIKCLNPIAAIGMDLFDDTYTVVDDINEAKAVLVRSASMFDLTLPAGLLAVARAGAGVNNIPLEECAEEGIVVFNTPGANANGVKEAVIAGLLMASRDYIGGYNWVQENKGDADIAKSVEKNKSKFAGTELLGKKIGVIGLGAIGVLVANVANKLGMEVFGYDPYVSVDSAWSLSKDIHHITNVDDIYTNCDYITMHVPLLDATSEMINEKSIAKMKDGVKLLNFSRDALVKDIDMAAALESGKVSCYVTDFPNAATVNMKNALTIPHLGASTEESEDNCAVMAVKQIKNFMKHGNIVNSVNYPSCDMGKCMEDARVAINHKNIPNMLSQFTTLFAAENVNISDMTNKSKKGWAYTLMDMSPAPAPEVIEKLRKIDGVVAVRVLSK